MFSKTNIISTLFATLWAFFGGYLLWGIIGDPLLTKHFIIDPELINAEPRFGPLALGCLVVGFAFSSLFGKWAAQKNIANGIQFGVWIGLLVGLGNGLIDFATANLIDMPGTLINAFIYIVFFAIMGGLTGAVFGKSTQYK